MITNGFQMVTDELVPGTRESAMVIKEVKPNGKVIYHDTGLILSARFSFVSGLFNHRLTISNLTLQAEFQRLHISTKEINLLGIYDMATAALGHEDVLEYISEMAKYTDFQPHLKLQSFIPSNGLCLCVYNFWIILAPNRINLLHKEKVTNFNHVILSR